MRAEQLPPVRSIEGPASRVSGGTAAAPAGGGGQAADQRRPRSVRAQAGSGARNPWDHLDGVQRGPVQPAEVVDESPAQDALSEEQEQVLLLQSAINKTYRHKLLEFRRSVTPDMLNGMRATLPPELVPELDAILREAAALSDDEVAEFESALAASEASAASPAAVEAEVLATTAASEAAADGPLFEDDPSQQAGPYALSPEERVAWEIMQDPNIPEDFMSYLASMLPEDTSETELQQLLDRLPSGVVGELQELFVELKLFEASGESDMDVVSKKYMDLSNRMDRLMEEVERQEAAVWEETRRLQQPGAPTAALDSRSSGGGPAPSGRFIGPAPPSWQEARQQQQQQRRRRALAAWPS
ncbi:hypothetical protein Rsub_10853 [Raphidocelis subcapitata]|uniref:Uncharacterized protein n=1 Tax=Raphidocelis subcapitata TaxID=307507 RepID=A0A2V0PL98_9CHLO|nr:hypothetical protein Rsub_10853 [Raphidocelis subcapitata]|eukprot:GBF98107.1 hypothetical protein Rsub_10853 [Raphidocelis subcapitata]